MNLQKNSKREWLKMCLRLELAKKDFWEFCLFYDREFFIEREFLKAVAEAWQTINDTQCHHEPVKVILHHCFVRGH